MNPATLARLLVALFPRRFKEEYADDLVHLFAEQWRDAGNVAFKRRAQLVFDLGWSATR